MRMRKENGYTYLEVSWSNMGYNAYTEEYVTNFNKSDILLFIA